MTTTDHRPITDPSQWPAHPDTIDDLDPARREVLRGAYRKIQAAMQLPSLRRRHEDESTEEYQLAIVALQGARAEAVETAIAQYRRV